MPEIVPLSPSGRRALAATMIGTATGAPPLVCSTLADLLDAVSFTVLSTAGLSPNESRAVLTAMWVEPVQP